MREKYENALIALSEILLDKQNALLWKDTQLDLRNKEIETLKAKLEYIESLSERER